MTTSPTPAERWCLAVFAAAREELTLATNMIAGLTPDHFVLSPVLGSGWRVEPVAALASLQSYCDQQVATSRDEALPLLIHGIAAQKLRELSPELEDFVGLQTITGLWKDRMIAFDRGTYAFHFGEMWVPENAPRRPNPKRETFLRAIRLMSNEQLHVQDLVTVSHKLDPPIVAEFRIVKHGQTKILYAVDEASDRVIFMAGTSHGEITPSAKLGLRRAVFAWNLAGLTNDETKEMHVGEVPSTACREFPEDASYKTIGLPPCKRCGSSDCWAQYLAWEKHQGITLNKASHPPDGVDEDLWP